MDDRSQNHEQGRFEGKILGRLDAIDLRLSETLAWLREQDTRLRAVEQEAVRVKAWAAALGAVAGIATSFLARLVKW